MTFPQGSARFHTTRWSVVLAAGGRDLPARTAALDELARAYWFPLYGYLRRTGRSADDAADLVQQFFAQLLERGDFERVDPARGRFRAWLLTALRNFVAKDGERKRALKRGGGRAVLSIDAQDADTRFRAEPEDAVTPEVAFERSWARSVLDRALERLRDEHERIGRAAHFDALFAVLVGDGDELPHAELARALGISENAFRVALHRARKRLGELVRDEVVSTLADPREADDEVRRLFETLGGRRGG